MLVYGENVPKHFWRITIVAGGLLSGDSEIRVAIVKIAKTNTILKRPTNKLFIIEKHIMTLTKQIRQWNKS